MFRFAFVILMHCIFISQIGFGFIQNNDRSTVCVCHCNCDMQIGVINDELDEDQRKRVSKPSNCMEATAKSMKSGIYEIQLINTDAVDLEVFCEESVDSGDWLVIQRRQSGTVDFNRGWHDYKEGFGDLRGNYWIGLEKLYALTSGCEQELYIQMKRRNGKEEYAKYSVIQIADKSEGYALKKLDNYSGNAENRLASHLGMKFSTYDRDNDESDLYNCAEEFKGGWWFRGCYDGYLNGVYGVQKNGVSWRSTKFDEFLTFVQMMIRPNHNCVKQLMLERFNLNV